MFQGKAIFCPSEKFMIIASNTNVNVGPMKICRGLISNVIRNTSQLSSLNIRIHVNSAFVTSYSAYTYTVTFALYLC